MRAAVCHEFGAPLRIEDIEIDPPQAGEVRIDVRACGICHSDIHYIDGAWGGELPTVFGHEAAGLVEQVGPGVTGVQPGDRVIATLMRCCGECYYCTHDSAYLCAGGFALDDQHRLHGTDGGVVRQGLQTGAFAEQIVVDQSQVAVIPDDVAFESAALLGCGVLTGWGAVVNTAAMPAGGSCAVLGTGGVGINTLQSAALAGAETVIAIDSSPGKLSIAADFGATAALDPTDVDIDARVHALTDGRGVDFAFVTVGSSKAITQALRLIRPGGTVVLVGMPAAGDFLQLDASDLAGRGHRILGSKMGSSVVKRDIPRLIELYRAGRFKLDELVSGRYPLERINEAIESVKGSSVLRNVIVF
ncbi:MAG: Zn-dependent alcohol dehydrogenase [Halofilum sp. (in: g-proteobacteria)]|nr:Zn-dependent alcohol dehydrogenase [Halofilum sp. (in: g-proteobacteria)]